MLKLSFFHESETESPQEGLTASLKWESCTGRGMLDEFEGGSRLARTAKISGGVLKELARKTKRERSAEAERLVSKLPMPTSPGIVKTGGSKVAGAAEL